MINNILMAKSSNGSEPVPASTPTPQPVTEISDRTKSDWNRFLSFLDEKGVRGNPDLDKGGKGEKLFDEYISKTKDTTLTRDVLPLIRKGYMDLRQSNIQDIQSGKGALQGKTGKDVDFSNFMRHIVENEKTSNPNYVGQHLTQTFFPPAKKTLASGETVMLRVYNPKSKESLLNK